jgi:putative ABC transport system substrate-binding protein
VFVNVADPVGGGFVSSYAQPGGNITGFSNFEPAMGGKWVQVLKDLDPRVRRIAILFNPETAPYAKNFLPSFKAACATFGLTGIEAPVRNVTEINQTVDALARESSGALITVADIFIATNRDLIIGLAMNNHLPLLGAFRDFPQAGALASYGSSSIDLFRNAASYVDRILKGAKPADLPIQSPTKFELVVNLKTARSLGLTINHDFLLRADDVVE